MSYNVVQRTTEIGVRIALGAQLKTVLWMILRESLILLVIGVRLGLPLAVLATRSIRNHLFGLSAIDPATFGIAIAVVIHVSGTISYGISIGCGEIDSRGHCGLD